MLSRIAPVAAIALCPALASAGPKVDMSCQDDIGTPENCVPLIACIGGEGNYFTGRAMGWNEGTFAGDTQAGPSCSGAWTSQNSLGLGQAVFECDNGTSGVAFFTYQDSLTGTATGQGLMSDGSRLRVWSGRNIRQFIANKSGDVDAALTCGEVVVPIS
ncbi:hypothetical protein [Roseobacter sinensis]|uniref:Uncharacterized protein n=1 Tax=Roseobacter sinensis TaxID=2931391 RepID=A0ABT3B980_9RHOB|nr:hypothetical protein [Roseobacter sp. WL0113]MCV3270121.1 hypothetical protein [Roseobacter sp. WL0113]